MHILHRSGGASLLVSVHLSACMPDISWKLAICFVPFMERRGLSLSKEGADFSENLDRQNLGEGSLKGSTSLSNKAIWGTQTLLGSIFRSAQGQCCVILFLNILSCYHVVVFLSFLFSFRQKDQLFANIRTKHGISPKPNSWFLLSVLYWPRWVSCNLFSKMSNFLVSLSVTVDFWMYYLTLTRVTRNPQFSNLGLRS